MKKHYLKKTAGILFILCIFVSIANASVIKLPEAITSDTTLLTGNTYLVPRATNGGTVFIFPDEHGTILPGEGVLVMGCTLTIQPGVTILFDSIPGSDTYSVSIIAYRGLINADGTGGDSIIFTGFDDPMYGAGGSNAMPGYWGGVVIFSDTDVDGTSTFKNCKFRYGMKYFRKQVISGSDTFTHESLNNYIGDFTGGGIDVKNCYFELGGSGININLEGNFFVDIQSNYIDSGVVGIGLEGDYQDHTDGIWGNIINNNITVRGTLIDYEDTEKSSALSYRNLGETGLVIKNNSFISEDGIPAVFGLPLPDDLATNTFSSNYLDAIGLYVDWDGTGALKDQTIPNLGKPYFVTEGQMNIDNNVTITVAPGVVFKFDTGGLIEQEAEYYQSPGGIYINPGSKLILEGTADSPIVFTSVHDDSYGGNTDKGSDIDYLPVKGREWTNLNYNTGETISFKYCIFKYGGAPTQWDTDGSAVVHGNFNDSIVFENCIFEENYNGAIDQSGSNNNKFELKNDTFINNTNYAVKINNANNLNIFNSYFSNNDSAVIVNNNINNANLGNLNNTDTTDDGGNIWKNNIFDIVSYSNITIKAEGNTFDSTTFDGIVSKFIDNKHNAGNGFIDFATQAELRFLDRSDTYAEADKKIVLAAIEFRINTGDNINFIQIKNSGDMDSSAFKNNELMIYTDADDDGIFDTFEDTIPAVSNLTYQGNVSVSLSSPIDTKNIFIVGEFSSNAPDSTYFQAYIDTDKVNLTDMDTGPSSAVFSNYKVYYYKENNKYWVDANNGADTNLGYNPFMPFKTITKALSRIDTQGFIYLADGIYSETVSIDTDYVSIIGADTLNCIIKPSGPLEINACTGVNIKNLQITGTTNGIEAVNSNYVLMENLYVNDNSSFGIYLNNSSYCTITNSLIKQNTLRNIKLSGADNNTIINNSIVDATFYGIDITSGSVNNILANNNITGNQAGIYIHTSESNHIENNNISNNSLYGIWIASDNNIVKYNLISSNSSEGIYLGNGADNTLIEQNDIVNNTKYQIKLGSNCLADTFNKNNIMTSSSNSDSAVENLSNNILDFTRNFWDTISLTGVVSKIHGTYSDSINYSPFRLTKTDTAANADTVAPEIPVLSVDTSVTGQITLSWQNPTKDEEYNASLTGFAGVKIYREVHSALTSNWDYNPDTIIVISNPDTSWTDAGLDDGNFYHYRITAYDDNSLVNESFYSDTVSAAVPHWGPKWYVNDASTDSDIYTVIAGDDSKGNGSEAAPFLTINKALNYVKENDTIYIDAGIYSETFTIDTNNISIIGADSSVTVLQSPADSTSNTNYGIYAANVQNPLIKNLNITDAYYGIYFYNVDTAIITQCSIEKNGAKGLYFDNGCYYITVSENEISLNNSGGLGTTGFVDQKYFTISDNLFLNNSSSGIYTTRFKNALIENNIFNSNGNDGIFFHMFSNDNIIKNNIFTNHQDGLQLLQSSYNTILNNQIYSNSSYGINLSNAEGNLITLNEIYSNSASDIYISSSENYDTITKNNFPVFAANKINSSSSNLFDFTRNYFSTTDSAAIKTIFTGTGADSIVYYPYRLDKIDTSVNASDTLAPLEPIIAIDTVTGRIIIDITDVTKNDDNSALNDLAGYKIYRNFSADTFGDLVSTGTDTTYIDTSAAVGQTYYYFVVAYDTNSSFINQSFYSSPVFGYIFELGDVNNDNKVDFEDFISIGEKFGTDYSPFDFNRNGKVDIDDWKYYIQNK